jgi:hypothetical protein
MNSLVHHGATGGYVVWLRVINKVVFFNCEQLRLAEAGIHWEKGLDLGQIEDMKLEKIFGNL